MAEKPKSFEEFYSKSKDDVLDIDIVADYADNHDGDIGAYFGDMFCPECKNASLSFVHKTSKRRAHLKKKKTSCHNKECSYNYDYASKKETIKYVGSLTDGQIQDRLNSMMNMLFRTDIPYKAANEIVERSIPEEPNPMLLSVESGNNNIYKALRRKKLNAWIDASDGEDFFAFYGRVKLKVVEKEKIDEDSRNTYQYNLLQIYTQNKKGEWKFRTSLYRGKIKDIIKEDSIYNIVIIGHLDFKFKPFTIKLANNYAIKYREIL